MKHLRLGIIGLVVVVMALVAMWVIQRSTEEDRVDAEQTAAQRTEEAAAARAALEAQCEVGIRSACDQLEGLADQPDPDDAEIQDSEVQEPEVQEPEQQDAERQDQESQDPERQEGDPNDPELQDGESDDADPDDPETQDPEQDDPETQDPEIDDPDPNSALQFAVRDDCEPDEGQVVADVDLAIERGDGAVTFVLTCTTRPAPEPLEP